MNSFVASKSIPRHSIHPNRSQRINNQTRNRHFFAHSQHSIIPGCASQRFERRRHQFLRPSDRRTPNRIFVGPKSQRTQTSSIFLASSSSPSSSLPLGIFVRDDAASDMGAYLRTLHLLGLGKLQQLTALKLIEGIQISKNIDSIITLELLTVVPFFKVKESYSLTGAWASFGRRDLRPGRQRGQASFSPDGDLCLRSTWGEPHAGSMEERMSLKSDGSVLEVMAMVEVGDCREQTKLVYRRVAAWKPKYTWNPIAALSLMAKENNT